MDEDGYPTDEELAYIKKYDLKTGCYEEIMHYIEERWWRHYGWEEYDRTDSFDTTDMMSDQQKRQHTHKVIMMSTGGWSGNESIIGAMMRNFYIAMHEVEWRRGGHYVFEFPLEQWKKKVR